MHYDYYYYSPLSINNSINVNQVFDEETWWKKVQFDYPLWYFLWSSSRGNFQLFFYKNFLFVIHILRYFLCDKILSAMKIIAMAYNFLQLLRNKKKATIQNKV